MPKRPRSVSPSITARTTAKKARNDLKFQPNKVATAAAAARADSDPPFYKLIRQVRDNVKQPATGRSVVYWMRMEDLRIGDNKALAQASAQAQKENIPLLALFVLSPQDYIAHDRAARRIDFTLRNLQHIKISLGKLDIPLFTVSHTPRTTIPEYVHSILEQWEATHLFANIEYAVDELRRDIKVCELAKEDNKVACQFVHNKCVIAPGEVLSKQQKPYSVYSPFLRAWTTLLQPSSNDDPLACAPTPAPNDASIRQHATFGKLFDQPVPDEVEGFALKDAGEREHMRTCWPEGEEAAKEMLRRFLYTAARTSQMGAVDPLAEGAMPPAKNPAKASRVGKYGDARDKVNADTTSRLSPYLAAGVISVRECIRATLELPEKKTKKIDVSRDTGIGRWVQELAWRDFYTHVLALFPRVSMGRPFQEKFADIRWEMDALEDRLEAWKEGRTGVPIVDAAMRQGLAMGWMHNRVRMVAAMYLVKDLMVDWRLGERHFMEIFVDGDLASNNGGWQWSASTGTDPAPYFRIFNPYTQSTKADPTGDYIRHFVPELAKVRGPDVHKPPPHLADKLGYPRPLVNHDEARKLAIERYKNPGGK